MSFPPPPVHIAVEGITDQAVIARVLHYIGLTPGLMRGLRGKAYLLQQLSKYNAAARFANWFAVVDLDQDADCAPDYIRQILPKQSEGMLLRIPVRAIEAWLMADRERLAAFLNISIDHVPQNPDLESNPKTAFVNLARRCRQTALREDIVPRPGSGAQVGPGYAGRIQEFVSQSPHRWRPEIAAENSDSLKRCINALQNWKLIEPS